MNYVTIATVLTTLVVASTAAPAGAGVAAADTDFVSVSVDAPAFPSPDQPFRIETTVTNAESSSTTYDVTSIEVRKGEFEHNEAVTSHAPGPTTVEPGETVTRSLAATVDDPGERDLYVHVVLEDQNDDQRRVVQPITVDVDGEHPQLALSTESAVAGEPRTMNLSVANGRDDAVRQLSVDFESDAVSVDDDSRVRGRLDSGELATFSFVGEANETGRHPVEATLSYTTAAGERRTMTRLFRADFTRPDPPSEYPQLSVETESAVADAWRSLNVTVSNGMDSSVRQVSLEAASDEVEIRQHRRVTPSLDAGEARTFSYRARATDPGTYPVNLTFVYVDGDGATQQVSETVRADFTEPTNPGNVSLTGVSAEYRGDTVAISGSAANLGGEAVDSVVVSVREAENVEKAQPQPEYFVGTVESSDFVTFDVNARLSNNRTTVPLEVSYVVDDVRRNDTVTVDVGPPPSGSDGVESTGGGGPPLALGGVGLLVLAVAGIWWTRR